MTMIEILIVLAIISTVAGMVALSFRQVQRSQARSSASKLSAAVRYLYDQAVVTGRSYRLTIDLDKNNYAVEKSDDRFYLVSGKEKSEGKGKGVDEDDETKRQDEDEARDRDNNTTGIAKQLLPPPKLKRAHFQSFKDSTLPKVELKGVWIRDVYTPRQREPYTEGKAYLHFFPDGDTEAAVIHLVSGDRPAEDDDKMDASQDKDVYTLIVHPLTGRVELKSGDIDPPRSFDTSMDEGDAEGR